ncbi:hypothetical protein ACEQ8H_003297 [Pleosporales sp. CAS-2024a]
MPPSGFIGRPREAWPVNWVERPAMAIRRGHVLSGPTLIRLGLNIDAPRRPPTPTLAGAARYPTWLAVLGAAASAPAVLSIANTLQPARTAVLIIGPVTAHPDAL